MNHWKFSSITWSWEQKGHKKRPEFNVKRDEGNQESTLVLCLELDSTTKWPDINSSLIHSFLHFPSLASLYFLSESVMCVLLCYDVSYVMLLLSSLSFLSWLNFTQDSLPISACPPPPPATSSSSDSPFIFKSHPFLLLLIYLMSHPILLLFLSFFPSFQM